MNFNEAKGSGFRGPLGFYLFKIGKGNHVTVVVDHESLAVFADFEVADESRQLVDFKIHADNAFQFPNFVIGGPCNGNSRFLGSKEDVGIRPDNFAVFERLFVPGALARIKAVCRIQLL